VCRRNPRRKFGCWELDASLDHTFCEYIYRISAARYAQNSFYARFPLQDLANLISNWNIPASPLPRLCPNCIHDVCSNASVHILTEVAYNYSRGECFYSVSPILNKEDDSAAIQFLFECGKLQSCPSLLPITVSEVTTIRYFLCKCVNSFIYIYIYFFQSQNKHLHAVSYRTVCLSETFYSLIVF